MIAEIKNIARNAGQKMLNAGEKAITTKSGKGNFVTQYDSIIQNFINEELENLLPYASFMGEEDGKDIYNMSEYVFVVDPIDGTTNFIRDFRHSCVSIGLLKNGKPYIGVIYNPYLDEMFYAKLGGGAFLNGRSIHVSSGGLKNSLVSFGTSPYYPEIKDKTFETAEKIFEFAADIRRCGSAALDICYVASGRTDLYFEYLLSPWDFAASSVILTEAGGIIKTSGYKDPDYSKKNAILASNPCAYNEFKKLIDF